MERTLDYWIELSLSRCKYPHPFCPLCLVMDNKCVEMVFRRSHIVERANIPVRDDVAFKCPKCNHTIHVGNPMTRTYARNEIRARGSEWLLTPTYNRAERKNPEIIKRLKALGYGY